MTLSGETVMGMVRNAAVLTQTQFGTLEALLKIAKREDGVIDGRFLDDLESVINQAILPDQVWFSDSPVRLAANPMQLAVREFQDAMGVEVAGTPQLPRWHERVLNWELVKEEAFELQDAMFTADLVGVADALGDLLYVVFHAANVYGINLQPVFDEIHRSNMAKRGPDGQIDRREDGKVLKPPGWTPPDVHGELVKQGWMP